MTYFSRAGGARSRRAKTRSQIVFRLVWTLVLVGGIGVVVLLSAQLSSKIEEMREVPEDNAQWNLSQIEVAFLKLRIAADNVLLEGESALPEFRKWFDIHYSRIELVSTSADAKEIHKNPQLHHLHQMLREFNYEQVVLVDGPDSLLLANMPDFIADMQEIAFAPRELSVGGVELKSARSDEKRNEIVKILQTIALVSTFVMISLIAAFVFVWLQRRRLNMQSAEIRKAGKFHKTILRASLDAIVVVDGSGKITDFNGSAEKVFGLNRADVIGKSLSQTILPERFRSAHEAGMAHYTSADNSNIVDEGRLELVAVHADGHEFPVEVSISEAHSEDGRIFVSYIRDITHEKQNNEDLQAARDQALDAYREKSRFLAVMSHEMRTPLNGIISSLHLMRDDPLSERQERFVSLADHSSNVLLNHINDVLTIERLDSGETKSAKQVFLARDIAQGLIEVMRPLADEQNTSLLLEVEGEEAFVLGEQRQIVQVLTNLLSNAIKFTASGEVTLGITSERVKLDELKLDFSITLAVQNEVPQPREQDAANAEPSAPTGLKILVVEDNPINRELLGAMLERDGHIVSFATDGFEGVHVASKNVFDVILMDISMPNMNGIKATTTIKSSQGLSRNTPIYAVTAHAMPAEIAEFEKAGMEGCLLKPIRVGKLRALLGEISQGGPVGVPPMAPPNPTTANGIAPLLSPDQLRKMREVFGPETMIDKVQAFLKEGDLLIGAILNNTVGQDRETLQSSTHKLSGSCAMFGAALLRQTLTALETACKEDDEETAAALQAKVREQWHRTRTALDAIYTQG